VKSVQHHLVTNSSKFSFQFWATLWYRKWARSG